MTSATTRGTSGSIRQAEELSTTMAPAAAKRGASSRDDGGAGGEQGQLQAGQVGAWPASSTTTSPSRPRQRPAGRAGRGEEADLVDGEGPLVEQGPHDATDLAGGTDHTYAHVAR